MNNQTEALRLIKVHEESGNIEDLVAAYNACKEALAQPAQVPVAWGKVVEGRFSPSFSFKFSEQKRDGYVPLYTHPAPSCNCKDKK